MARVQTHSRGRPLAKRLVHAVDWPVLSEFSPILAKGWRPRHSWASQGSSHCHVTHACLHVRTCATWRLARALSLFCCRRGWMTPCYARPLQVERCHRCGCAQAAATPPRTQATSQGACTFGVAWMHSKWGGGGQGGNQKQTFFYYVFQQPPRHLSYGCTLCARGLRRTCTGGCDGALGVLHDSMFDTSSSPQTPGTMVGALRASASGCMLLVWPRCSRRRGTMPLLSPFDGIGGGVGQGSVMMHCRQGKRRSGVL